MTDKRPTADNIKQARANRKLSQSAAADLIYVSRHSWQMYESGDTQIKLGLWELFLFKTGQLFLKPTIPDRARSKHPGRVENLTPYVAKRTKES